VEKLTLAVLSGGCHLPRRFSLFISQPGFEKSTQDGNMRTLVSTVRSFGSMGLKVSASETCILRGG
jgi:hypothetical protein